MLRSVGAALWWSHSSASLLHKEHTKPLHMADMNQMEVNLSDFHTDSAYDSDLDMEASLIDADVQMENDDRDQSSILVIDPNFAERLRARTAAALAARPAAAAVVHSATPLLTVLRQRPPVLLREHLVFAQQQLHEEQCEGTTR